MKKNKVRPTFSVVDVLVLLVLLLAVTVGIYWREEARRSTVKINDQAVLTAELEYESYLDLIRPGQTLFDREKNAIGIISDVKPEITPEGKIRVILQCEMKSEYPAPGQTAEFCTKELAFRAAVISAESISSAQAAERSGTDE